MSHWLKVLYESANRRKQLSSTLHHMCHRKSFMSVCDLNCSHSGCPTLIRWFWWWFM